MSTTTQNTGVMRDDLTNTALTPPSDSSTGGGNTTPPDNTTTTTTTTDTSTTTDANMTSTKDNATPDNNQGKDGSPDPKPDQATKDAKAKELAAAMQGYQAGRRAAECDGICQVNRVAEVALNVGLFLLLISLCVYTLRKSKQK